MNCVKLVTVVAALLNSVQSKKICDFADIQCTTLGAENTYKSIVSGIPGLIESCDVLHLNDVKGEVPYVKYNLFNATMTGLPNCHVTQLVIYDEKLTYQYTMLCPQLVLNHNFIANGVLNSMEIDADGSVTFVLNDYLVDFKGSFEIITSEVDQNLHFHITHYVSEFEPKGEVTMQIHGPVHHDKVKSDTAIAYAYAHTADMEQFLRSPTMESYMALLMEKTNVYMRTFPIEHIIPA